MFEYLSQSSSLTLITFVAFIVIAAIVLSFCQQVEMEEERRE